VSKVNHEELVFAQLTGKYKHYCSDWDEMAIDENCAEFASCTCFIEAIEAGKLKDGWNDRIDAYAERNMV